MDREILTELFYQPAAVTRRAERGLGVGMALCRMLVEAHGGGWEIAPSGGREATFRIALPLAQRESR